MQYSLHTIQRPKSNKRRAKRVGRGNASQKGTFSGRGIKGQRSRSGGRRGLARRAAFQQLLIRTPKLKGFKRQSPPVALVTLAQLEAAFGAGDSVTRKKLVAKGIIRRACGAYKVLANGTLTKKLSVSAPVFSVSARKAIEKAGGSCETA